MTERLAVSRFSIQAYYYASLLLCHYSVFIMDIRLQIFVIDRLISHLRRLGSITTIASYLRIIGTR